MLRTRGFLATVGVVVIVCGLVLSCGGNGAKEAAERLLEQADGEYDKGEYDKALATIDSLRELYPTAIETRRKALSLQQAVALKQAQAELEATDSLLQLVTNDYNYQKMKVDKERAEFRATPETLGMLTRTQLRRDSLKARFELLCSKIRYIHKKQKE